MRSRSLLPSRARISLIACLAFSMLLAGAMPSFAGPKEDMYAEMLSLGAQMEAAKSQIQTDANAATEYKNLERRYRELSARLGGDDPAGIGISGQAPDRPYPTKGDGGAVAPPGCSPITTAVSESTPVAIVDNTVVSSSLVVAGAGTYLSNIQLGTSITHTWAADLDITLTSPAGTTIIVSFDNGAGNDDVFDGTAWSDGAGATNPPGAVTDNDFTDAVTETPLVVQEALSAFNGEDPNGTWTLDIGDDAGGDTGTLNSWSLDLTSLAAAPLEDAPVTATDMTAVATADNTTVSSTVDLAGGGAFICATELETFLTHTWAADLDITLTSPAGTVVTLTTDNGAGNDDVFNGTTWSDSAGDTVTLFTYADGVTATPLVVEEAMGAFYGEDPNGTWTLDIGDDAGGDSGTLSQFSVTVTTCSCTGGPGGGAVFDVAVPTANAWALTLLALLLAGAGLMVFRRMG